jgi:C-1 hydroxylase
MNHRATVHGSHAAAMGRRERLMSAAENKELFRRFVDAMNRGEWEKVTEAWSPEMVHYGRSATYGRDEVAHLMGLFRYSFPDLTFRIEDVVADGNRLSARMTATCTHLGDFAGIPASGRKVQVSVMEQVRIIDDKIVEHWIVIDELHFLNQLGVVDDDRLNLILA